MLAGTRDRGRVTRIRDLADALVHCMFSHDPFLATSMGVREYDARVPDLSPAARDSFAKAVAAVRAEAITAEPQEPQEAEERIIRAAVIGGCDRVADRNAIEAETHTVAETPLEGPPVLFATAARTVLPDEQAAADYLARLSGAHSWFAQSAQRIRDGREVGRLPVASLVANAIVWCDRQLQQDIPATLVAPEPPAGWTGADAWRRERDQLITTSSGPACSPGASCSPRCDRLLARTITPGSARCPAATICTGAASRCTPRWATPRTSCTRSAAPRLRIPRPARANSVARSGSTRWRRSARRCAPRPPRRGIERVVDHLVDQV
jgi:hypothetical protein